MILAHISYPCRGIIVGALAIGHHLGLVEEFLVGGGLIVGTEIALEGDVADLDRFDKDVDTILKFGAVKGHCDLGYSTLYP